MRVPTPNFEPGDRDAALAWVRTHLAGLWSGPLGFSSEFVGGQSEADRRIASFEVTGYAARRNEVWPTSRRGASMLSPYIRHGLLSLPRVWEHVGGGPPRDAAKFRDELLWQEYARHLYARLGEATARPLRFAPPRSVAAAAVGSAAVGSMADGSAAAGSGTDDGPVEEDMACWQWLVNELAVSGWLPNQARMWFASHWTVRSGWSWQQGEDYFFARLLDGSRAANRLGWQWTVGTATGKPYGFSRWQVKKRAPGLCDTCVLNRDCPIEQWPEPTDPIALDADPRLRNDDGSNVGGPDAGTVWVDGHPAERSATGGTAALDAVWITAESLGADDPALTAHPEVPALFVFDAALLRRLQLSSHRLVFLVECLADLASHRQVDVRLGSPGELLSGPRLAATYAPVPGWRRIAEEVQPVVVHPWPWLRRPAGGSVASFSAWRR